MERTTVKSQLLVREGVLENSKRVYKLERRPEAE